VARLVLACLCELTALVLDFLEQADVFDGDHRLVGESLNQLNLFVAESPNGFARQCENADGFAFA
jgi:hypothetical protein